MTEHYLIILAAAVGGILALKIIKAIVFRIILILAVFAFLIYLLQ